MTQMTDLIENDKYIHMTFSFRIELDPGISEGAIMTEEQQDPECESTVLRST